MCELGADGQCRGCRRTLEEIAGWTTYTSTQREAIISDLARRRLRQVRDRETER
jgi:uncharacterized protein